MAIFLAAGANQAVVDQGDGGGARLASHRSAERQNCSLIFIASAESRPIGANKPIVEPDRFQSSEEGSKFPGNTVVSPFSSASALWTFIRSSKRSKSSSVTPYSALA